ncbi:hypothetical protein Emtol_0087 (plasmid) [Emticicia oligotrophica DSM 17448]|uniref:Uroporphyrinogen decarboxylase (URO-D) domain-containing protein n=1 Tax=Emticicia oligotrophica (strain DSM 17448 / CIP 109782 / MTCC 6937 / GPTSA100-15) TaxID=929562 RepID=A0ABM5N7V8_EMTOG|nr:uroporphyrinogen decarboxylase family protein [Emticicia oligotrophica]AFK05605.1 hypothetical protein Emtol_0087 [Emticicia oligotrophica DSM 17448]
MGISFWKHHPYSDQNGHLLAQEAIDFQNTFQFDFLKLTSAGDWLAVCYGAGDELWENDSLGRRKITSFPLQETRDFYHLKSFSFQEKMLVEILDALRICCENVSVPVYVTIFCPLSQLIQISGIELFLKTAQKEPEAIHAALAVIIQNTKKTIDAASKVGVGGLYFVTQHMQTEILSLETYQQFGRYSDEICLIKASELFDSIIFHLHGNDCYACIAENIPKMSIHCAYSEVSTSNTQSIEKAGYPIIYGLAHHILSKANSFQDCKEILDNFPTSSFLTCDCVLPLNFPNEKINLWTNFVRSLS